MTWQADMESAAFLAAVNARVRTVRARVELIDANDVVKDDLPVVSGSVSFQGESSEQWACELTISDPSMIPTGIGSSLDPRQKLRARVWWGILVSGSWVEIPIGTYFLRQPRTTESVGSLSCTLTGRDALSEAKRGGYGTAALSVGGMTVSNALAAIFDRVAPWAAVRIMPSTVTLPATYELTAGNPSEDWDNIAALAGFAVRSDREGVIRAQPAPNPTAPRFNWTEGPDCRVAEITREVDDDIINRVVVVSTNTEITIPVVGKAEITDAGSPYWVGYGPFELRIESDVVTTVGAANNMAALHLGKLSKAQETVEITIPQRGDVSYRDLATIARRRVGVAGLWRVSSWTLPLTPPSEPPAPMRVKMMTRQATT